MLLCLHNRARGRNGLGPLGEALALHRAAQSGTRRTWCRPDSCRTRRRPGRDCPSASGASATSCGRGVSAGREPRLRLGRGRRARGDVQDVDGARQSTAPRSRSARLPATSGSGGPRDADRRRKLDTHTIEFGVRRDAPAYRARVERAAERRDERPVERDIRDMSRREPAASPRTRHVGVGAACGPTTGIGRAPLRAARDAPRVQPLLRVMRAPAWSGCWRHADAPCAGSAPAAPRSRRR